MVREVRVGDKHITLLAVSLTLGIKDIIVP